MICFQPMRKGFISINVTNYPLETFSFPDPAPVMVVLLGVWVINPESIFQCIKN